MQFFCRGWVRFVKTQLTFKIGILIHCFVKLKNNVNVNFLKVFSTYELSNTYFTTGVNVSRCLTFHINL